MNFLFVVVIVVVIGGAIWTLSRKKKKKSDTFVNGSIGSGISLPLTNEDDLITSKKPKKEELM